MPFSRRSLNVASAPVIIASPVFAFERTDPFSVLMWFRGSSVTNGYLIGNLENNADERGWSINLSTGGLADSIVVNIISDVSPSNRIRLYTSIGGLDDAWHALAMTVDGSSDATGVLLYIDGYQNDVTITENNLTLTSVSTENLQIGERAGGSQTFTGWIDDTAIYDRVLTPAEVREAHQIVRGPTDLRELDSADSLIGYWRLGEGITPGNFGTVVDLSDTGADGTYAGSFTDFDEVVPPSDFVDTPKHILDSDTVVLVPFSEEFDLAPDAASFRTLFEAWRRYPLTSTGNTETPWPAGGPRQAASLGRDYSIWFDDQETNGKVFSGASDAAAVSALTGPAWTFEAWLYVHRDPADGVQNFFHHGTTGIDTEATNFLIRLRLQTDRTLECQWEEGPVGDNIISNTVATIPLRQWVHIAVVAVENGADRDVTFYIDGVAEPTVTGLTKASGGGSSAGWRMGQFTDSTQQAWVALAYVRVSSIARTAMEIAAEVANPGSILNDDDTLAYWDCQRPAVHADLSPRGHHSYHYGYSFSGTNASGQAYGVGTTLFPVNERKARRVVDVAGSGALAPRRLELADLVTLDSEFTVEAWVNLRGDTAQDPMIFRVGGNSADVTADGNHLFVLQLRGTGEVRVFWEHSVSVLVDLETTATWYSTEGESRSWRHIAARKRDVGGGDCEIDIFVNGSLIETLGPAQAADKGDIYVPAIYYVFYAHDNYTYDRGELRVSSVARTDGEILESYQRGVGDAGGDVGAGSGGIPIPHVMRARTPADDGYITWVVDSADFDAVQAPEAILPSSAVVVGTWDSRDAFVERVDEVPVIQEVDSPTTADDPGIGKVVVLVDTVSGNWSDADIILLPAAPLSSARVVVKDSTGSASSKTITVGGNGATIDGAASDLIAVDYASKTYLFDGSEWKVV